MKVKVLKAFKDKNNNALCKEGVILDLSEDRVKEINSTGYGIFLELVGEEMDNVTDNIEEDIIKNEITVTDDKAENEDKPLNEMTVTQLKELAETLGIEIDRKDLKDDIIAKINEYQQANEGE